MRGIAAHLGDVDRDASITSIAAFNSENSVGKNGRILGTHSRSLTSSNALHRNFRPNAWSRAVFCPLFRVPLDYLMGAKRQEAPPFLAHLIELLGQEKSYVDGSPAGALGSVSDRTKGDTNG